MEQDENSERKRRLLSVARDYAVLQTYMVNRQVWDSILSTFIWKFKALSTFHGNSAIFAASEAELGQHRWSEVKVNKVKAQI